MYEADIIKYLMADTDREIETIHEYNAAVEVAREKAKEKEGKDGWYCHYLEWNKPRPNKTKIKDNLKMIRRLSLELEKHLNKIDIH